MRDLYPLKFDNIYIEKIWGGEEFNLFRKNVPPNIVVGESWDVVSHEEGVSVVSNGFLKGKTLDSLLLTYGESLIGSGINPSHFPLFLRLVNPKEDLSIQVHPNDQYALKIGDVSGKVEAWYVMETYGDAYIHLGSDKCSKEELLEALKTNEIQKYIKKIPVKQGDVFLINSGVVHAMGPRMMVVEISQNSNTTFRVHDYNRGRPLDVEHAMNVIEAKEEGKHFRGVTINFDGYSRTIFFHSNYFSWELVTIFQTFRSKGNSEAFEIFTCVKGHAKIIYEEGVEFIQYGDSVLIPASMSDYKIIGDCKLLKTSIIPNYSFYEELKNSINGN